MDAGSLIRAGSRGCKRSRSIAACSGTGPWRACWPASSSAASATGCTSWRYLVIVYRETGDPAILGLFSAVRLLPYILLSIPAGLVADRFDRRMVLLVGDLGRGACMVLMAWVVAVGGSVIWVMVLAIVAACGSTFFYPAIGAYIPSLVADERELGPANSAWATLDNLGFIIGPAIGGVLLMTGGVVAAFLLNAISFVVIAVVLWRLPPARPRAQAAGSSSEPDDPEITHRARGVESRSLRRSIRPLTGVAILQAVSWVLEGAVTVLTVILAIDVLKAGEGTTGTLNAAIGVGGVAGAVIAGLLVLRRRLTVPILVGGLALALGFAALGVAPSLPLVFVAIAVNAAGHLVLDVLVATIIQRVLHESALGRGNGIIQTVGSIGEAAGALVVPAGIAVFGLTPTLTVGAVFGVGGVAVALVLIGAATTRPESPFEATFARVTRLPLFAGVPAARLERALGQLRARPTLAGEVVIRQGDAPDFCYLVQSGAFVVTIRDGAATRARYGDWPRHRLRRARPAPWDSADGDRHGRHRRRAARDRGIGVPRARRRSTGHPGETPVAIPARGRGLRLMGWVWSRAVGVPAKRRGRAAEGRRVQRRRARVGAR